jgi:hypothetical protein
MAHKNQTPTDLAVLETASNSSSSSEIIYTPPSSSPIETMSTSPATGASISIREYIYLMPYPLPKKTPIPYTPNLPGKNPLKLPTALFEPTSTLVLTSSLKTFVDVRFFKPTKPGESPLPEKGERERLEWGFAGSNASHAIADPNAPDGEEGWDGVTYSKWTQFVDSRFPVGSTDIPIDEGLMYPIDAQRTLEHGHMYHPSAKGVRTHEEMWVDPPVGSTSNDGKKRCVVLRLQNDGVGVRGVVVRLGKWCQGVVKMRNEGVTVERWEWTGPADGKSGSGVEEAEQWHRIARIGDQMLPCAVTFRHEVLKVGGKIKHGNYEWNIEEVWEWE